MRAIFAAFIVTLLIGTSLTTYAAYQDPKYQIEVLQTYLPIEVPVPVSWAKCGDWNGAFYPGSYRVVMCEENLELPLGAQRMIFLHELGHAYTIPEGIETTRWGGNYEDEADEFAAIISIAQGRPGDLVVMAQVWEDWAKENPPEPGDTHSPALERALVLRKLYMGYMAGVGPDFDYYRGALDFWHAQFLLTEKGTCGPN